jgi:hypothetical protein
LRDMLLFLRLVVCIVGPAAFCMWAWYGHCFFFFHKWDRSRRFWDLCERCGALRSKKLDFHNLR